MYFAYNDVTIVADRPFNEKYYYVYRRIVKIELEYTCTQAQRY